MGDLFGYLPNVLTVAAAVAGVLAFVLSDAARKTVRDQADRLRFLEDERQRMSTQLAVLEQENKDLRELVAGRVDFSALETAIEHLREDISRQGAERQKALCDAVERLERTAKAWHDHLNSRLDDLFRMWQARRQSDRGGR